MNSRRRRAWLPASLCPRGNSQRLARLPRQGPRRRFRRIHHSHRPRHNADKDRLKRKNAYGRCATRSARVRIHSAHIIVTLLSGRCFPTTPRPAVWTDGYYTATSTGDDVIQKHVCIADRAKMLAGQPATEQCITIDGVNFLNNADIDGQKLPPRGTPNIMMAAGGTQLKGVFNDDGIYFWKVHVVWKNPANTRATGPTKIQVTPYQYLCNGQLMSCVPQPDTERRHDVQGDKIMTRLVYRRLGGHESIVAAHSVATNEEGGVRWYEFRLDKKGDPVLYQQGTYAPEGNYRWMPSIAMDKKGDIGVGYSFGGPPNFPGQHFAARQAGDPKGQLTLRETVLAEGEASQKNTLRWEDYATTAMDPSDDCTFWYVGDYLKESDTGYRTKLGSFRLPSCEGGR